METLFTYLQKRLRGNSRSTYNVKKTFLLTWLGKVWISFFLLLTWFHNFSRFWWCFRQLFIFLIIFFSFLLSINANMVFMKMLFFDFFPWFVTDINSGIELSLNLRQLTESVILGYPASLWDTLVQRGHFPKNPAVQLRYFIKYSLHYYISIYSNIMSDRDLVMSDRHLSQNFVDIWFHCTFKMNWCIEWKWSLNDVGLIQKLNHCGFKFFLQNEKEINIYWSEVILKFTVHAILDTFFQAKTNQK